MNRAEYIDYLIDDYISLRYPISKIIIFGSCAKGEECYGSDIDLAIIAEGSTRLNWSQRGRLRSGPDGNICNLKVDYVFESEEGLEEVNMESTNDIRVPINKEGIILWSKKRGKHYILRNRQIQIT